MSSEAFRLEPSPAADLDKMFKLMYAAGGSRNVVHLMCRSDFADLSEGTEQLKVFRTKASIQAAMQEVNSASTYGLERYVAQKRGLHFCNFDRSRLFERLLRNGCPPIEECLQWPLSTMAEEAFWAVENLDSIEQTLRHPIWELLRAGLPSTKRLNALRRQFAVAALDDPDGVPMCARALMTYLVEELERRTGEASLFFMTRAALQLRLAERSGNLAHFTACHAALAGSCIPSDDRPHPIMRFLSAGISSYVTGVFSHVRLTGRSNHGVAIARGRLAKDQISLDPIDGQLTRLSVGIREFVATAHWAGSAAPQREEGFCQAE